MEKRKHIHLEKFKSALATILLCFIGLWAYSYDYLQVSPAEIYFNHEAGHTRDAVTISDDRTPIVNDPEWEYGIGEKHKFAYIKSQSKRSIKVQLNDGSYSGLMHLLIKVSYVSGHTDGIGTVCNLFVSNFNTDSLLTLFPTGGFPPSVGVHEFQWRWEIYAIPVNNSNYCAAWDTTSTSHHFYTLLATPQAPMAQPWERVLDYACDWASGQTNDENSATAITNSLFNTGFNYIGSAQYGSFSQFNLSAFILNIGNGNVNCLDLAKAVVTFGNSIGCGLSLCTYGITELGENPINGPLNCIDPIGSPDPTNNPFSSIPVANDCRNGGFVYHAFAEIVSISKVWDATLQYDIDTDPDNVIGSNPLCGSVNPSYQFSWLLPLKESEADYLIRLVDAWPVWNQQQPTIRRDRSFSIQQ